ncbi:Extracellular endo-alpha-(1-_5)-L-arabinanase [Pseudocercospora fuligena]|uniref:Extracellular endo-alpha-(1->5)-L-arabinanase n=1 Tax=Pseudocercospora fuligena TaxID=685502 RepID=A0A8H6VNA4_9PEZI|nr:Extracellular endo-alpha-(1->5)-L-arabinanase [Pseudocercospora fuligena]
MVLTSIRVGLTVWLLGGLALSAPLEKRDNLRPVISTDFPDPSIIKVGDTWYAFASQSTHDFKNIKVQLATSKDFNSWTLTGKDALGKMGSWVRANDPALWAPSVSRRPDGKFLMYYSAVTKTAGNGRFHCVGTAVADNVEGPYNSNTDEPFACPTDQGGALDASYFRDGDKHYALYKVDGNALGNGGSCGNGVPPIKKTPIMIQQVEADGTRKIGGPVELISNSWSDGPLVEAPYMIKNNEGMYVLFFSSNCWTTDLYDVAYATSRSPLGPFDKQNAPLYVTGTQGMIGPGGASVAEDGVHFALHGYEDRNRVGGRRSLYVTRINAKGRKVLLA